MALSKKKVSYFYQDDMNYYYGMHHPMKPFRLKLTHDLILSYRLYRSLRVLRPRPASAEEMMQFHNPECVLARLLARSLARSLACASVGGK